MPSPCTIELNFRVKGPTGGRGIKARLAKLCLAGAELLLKTRVYIEAPTIGRASAGSQIAVIDGEMVVFERPEGCRAADGEACPNPHEPGLCDRCRPEPCPVARWEDEGGQVGPAPAVAPCNRAVAPCNRCHRPLPLEPLGDRMLCGSCRMEMIHGPLIFRGCKVR